MSAPRVLFVLLLSVFFTACSCQKPTPPMPVALYPAYDVTETTAVLTWSLSDEEDFARYTLLRGMSVGVSAETGTEVATYNDTVSGSHIDTELAPETTYYYRVRVTDTEGLSSLSNEIIVLTEAEPPANPPEPVFLNPAFDLTPTTASLTWSRNNDDDFESYVLFRADVSGNTGVSIGTITNQDGTTHTDAGLTPETEYFYRVQVNDTEGLSADSNEIAASTPGAEPPVPVSLYPPVNQTSTSILLAWSQSNDPDFVSYVLYRDTTPGVDLTSTLVTTLNAVDTTSYDDTVLTEDTTYYYRVLITDTDGLTAFSNEIDADTLGVAIPQAPNPVTLSPATSITQTTLNLDWTVSTADDFLSYTLLRAASPGVTAGTGAVVTSSFLPLTVSHQDSGLTDSTPYYYVVRVDDTEGLFSLSNEIMVTTLTPVAPEQPTPVSLNPVYGETNATLTLTWTVNSDGDFASYTLLRDTVSIPDEFSGQVVFTGTDPVQVLFQDSSLTSETDYFYRVVVTNSAGLTALSNEVIGTTLADLAPGKPTPVLLGPVFNIDSDAMSLSWTENIDPDFDRYEVYRADGPGVTTADTMIATRNVSTATDFRDTGLTVSTEYFYRLWVYNAAGEFMPSNEVSGITSYNALPAAVTLQDPYDETGTGMTLAWEQSQALDFDKYLLYRSENPVVDQTAELVYETPDPSTLFFIDTGLTPDTRYYYRVYVMDVWGLTNGSNIVQSVTLNTEAPSCEISRSSTWQPVGGTFDLEAVNCMDNLTLVADLEVSWNFGDAGGWSTPTTTKTTSHAFPDRGAHTIWLEVSDGVYTSVIEAPVIVSEIEHIATDTFSMGRPTDTTPWPALEPLRTVFIDEFYVDAFEVTLSEYAAFLSDDNQPQYWTGQEVVDNLDGTYSAILGLEERPVNGVTWFHAEAFCAWTGRRLATEAEWEYAARGPSTGPNYEFPWGDALPQSLSPVPANFASLVGDTVDVENYPTGVTAWQPGIEIYQMAGNGAEWVQDFYDPDYYEWANTNGDNNNPTGPATSPFPPTEPAYRSTRGGSWVNDENPLRVSFRTYADPYLTGSTTIRCVTNVLP